jgi:NAD(P)-dependent dehydrogenase (short-subunit alcohol dehydrogenase family)
MSGFEKQTYVLTGASMGIGRALAEGLARRGAKLALNARGWQALDETAAICRGMGADVAVVTGNAARAEVARELVQRAEDLGNFKGIIHAAGVLRPGPAVWELSSEDFSEVVEASLQAAHELMCAGVPLLRQRAGFFVVFGSGAADITQPGIGAYCAAKAAEEHLARQLAVEAPEVATIIFRPGVVETRMQEQARSAKGAAADQLRPVFEEMRDRGQLITPERSAAFLLDLLENDPQKHHGQTVRAS